ncbi:MAG: hypothetical protein FWE38_02245 [Firmicutes bacterium]|nr:hypothetical protein [Bacillota bacterium]
MSQDNVSTTVTHNFHFAHRGNTWGQNRETNMIALRRDVRTTLNDETTTFTLTQLVLNFDHIVQMNLLPHRADDFTGTIRFRNGTGENDTWNSLGASGTGSIVVQTNNASQRTHSRMSITQGQALRTVNADQPLTIDFYYRLSTDPLATAEGFTPRHFSFTFELPRGNF